MGTKWEAKRSDDIQVLIHWKEAGFLREVADSRD
jgi:hypothetical protein